MAERLLYLDSFHDLTDASDNMEAGSSLLPSPQFSGQGDIAAGFPVEVHSFDGMLYIDKIPSQTDTQSRWFSFWVDVPLDSGYNIQVRIYSCKGCRDVYDVIVPASHFVKFDGTQPVHDSTTRWATLLHKSESCYSPRTTESCWMGLVRYIRPRSGQLPSPGPVSPLSSAIS